MSLRNILLSAGALAALAMPIQEVKAQSTQPDEVNIEASLNAAGYAADRSIAVSLPVDDYRLNARFAGQKIGRFANNEVSLGAEFGDTSEQTLNLEIYANQVDGTSNGTNVTDREVQLRAGATREVDYGGLKLKVDIGGGLAANHTSESNNNSQKQEFKISPMTYYGTQVLVDLARRGQAQFVAGIEGHLAAMPGSAALSGSYGAHGAIRITPTDDFSYEVGMRTNEVGPAIGGEFLGDIDPSSGIYAKVSLDIGGK